ncbi:hypothetical protein [Catenulispora pinisilvae]|uniref:hypothetical protein n=1 Tax=Catenulispora pinisilvae TaxID=2705253 RepID=UPI001890D9DD|nr:hypothetical protein [Catenulispora pinisilvae]
MNTPHIAASRRTGFFSRSGVRRLAVALAAVPVALLAAGCSSAKSSSDQSATDVINKLGAVPIPSAPQTQLTPSADESHPQLVAVGSAVAVTLPSGTGTITALGPTEDLPTPLPATMPTQVAGTITLRVATKTGTVKVTTTDLSSRDDHGNDIALTPVGVAQAAATAGGTADFVVRGTFSSGAAQITLREDGHVVAVWDFNIELD